MKLGREKNPVFLTSLSLQERYYVETGNDLPQTVATLVKHLCNVLYHQFFPGLEQRSELKPWNPSPEQMFVDKICKYSTYTVNTLMKSALVQNSEGSLLLLVTRQIKILLQEANIYALHPHGGPYLPSNDNAVFWFSGYCRCPILPASEGDSRVIAPIKQSFFFPVIQSYPKLISRCCRREKNSTINL